MKRLALLVGFVLLAVVVSAESARAYYLDTPHNESNGIYCYTCHSMSYWRTLPTGGVDVSISNAVCLQCHAEDSTDLLKGPAKKLHASSTTSDLKGTWSTQCTQCHDVHAQGQLDWKGTENNPRLFLASGTFATANGAYKYTPDSGNLSSTKLVVGKDYTTIGISVTQAEPGWEDTSLWNAKGGRIDAARAVDQTRGLILVPNKGTAADTFEIIAVSGNVIKVKGKMASSVAGNGQTFGVIYGQSLKSFVMPNGGTTVNDYRDVKFFKPGIIADSAGGYIDVSGSAKPQGLCQVCHDRTAYWKNNGSNTDHNPETNCGECHDIFKGLAGGAKHIGFIGDRLFTGCGNCHAKHVATPELGHSGGCNTCHANPKPTINSNILDGEGGVAVDVALTGNYASTGYSYSFAPRLTDDAGNKIGDDGFQVVDCSECHELKREAVLNSSHGGHGANTFGWNSTCEDCHALDILGVAKAVHNDTCTTCHDQDSVTAKDYTVRIEGDSACGVDGTAVGATRQSKCTDCHNSNIGAVHHVSEHGLASESCTTSCHITAGHQGNHTALVGGYVNCNTCHGDNIGSSSGAPVDPADTPVGRKIHDGCTACHKTDTTLKPLSQVDASKVTAMPDGGGSCLSCHDEYFSRHSNADHLSRVAGNLACDSCHNGTAGTAATVPTSLADPKLHDDCYTCHQATGVLRSSSAKAPGMAPPGGNCTTCHGGYFPSHKIDHETRVAGTTNCTGCHPATAGLPGDVPVNTSDNKIHDSCSTCHAADTNLLRGAYGKASAMPTAGDCNGCHGVYFVSHSHADHTGRVAMNGGCVGCHNGTQGTASGVPVDIDNSMVHDACTTCHDAATGALVGRLATGHSGGGDCVSCHSPGHDTNLDHNHRVSSLCSNCHAAGSAAAVDTLHTSCQTCHSYGGSRLNQATVAAVIVAGKGGNDQSCEACHTINLHHATREAANNSCTTTCHPAVDHGARVAGNAACLACHTTTVGSATGIPVSLTDAAIHDSCHTCHTFDAQWRGTLVNFTNLKGVNGSGPLPAGGGACPVCHTVATLTPTPTTMASFHHASPRTGVGQCETCHPDPRPSWQPVAPGDNGTASGLTRPTQMACLKCHVTFSGSNMTVTKFSRSEYRYYRDPWNRSTAHTIPVTSGRINNYGICLNCHYTGSAKVAASSQLSVWHPHPSRGLSGDGYWTFYNQNYGGAGSTWTRGSKSYGAGGSGDGAHFVPGRSKMLATNSAPQSGISGFNIFAPNYGGPPVVKNATWRSMTEPSYGIYGDQGSFAGPAYDTAAFTRITLPTVNQIANPHDTTLNATTRAVPVFASLAPNSSAPAATDNVKIKSATTSGGTVTVRASTSNSGGCATLTAVYGATSVAMGGVAANCTATISTPAYPTGGATVNVTTSNSLGLNVLAYPIKAGNPGLIAFSASTYTAAENGGSVTITATRLLGSSGSVGVSYATSNGTAAAGTDYTAAAGSLTWADGDTADKTFTVAITNNSGTAPNKTVNLTLYTATGGAGLANPKTALLTIVDDEILAGTIALSSSAYTVAENGGTVTITADRTGGSTGAVSVDYSTNVLGSTAVAGTDYPITTGTLTWASGDTASKSFTITTINHGQVKGNRTVNLYINNISGGASLGIPNTAVLTIVSPAVEVLNPWPAAPQMTGTTGNPSPYNFTIGNGANRLMLVAVSCLASGGQTGQTFTVMYGNKTLTQLALQNSRNRQTWLGYLKEADIAAKVGNSVTVTINGIHSNAAAFVASYINVNQISPIGAIGGNDWYNGAGSYSGSLTSPVSLTPLGVGAGGYGIYHWTTAYNTAISRTSDNESYVEQADVTLSLAKIGVASRPFLTAASTNPTVTWDVYGADLGATIQAITLNAAVGPVNLAFAGPTASINENAGQADIPVLRLGKATGAVSVAYATSNGTAAAGTDYSTSTGTLSWADGDMGAKSISIPILDNLTYASNKTVNLELSTPGGAALGVPATAVLTIVNNEAAIAFSSAIYSVGENGGSATITATRTGGFQGAAGVSYATVPGGTAVDGVEYTGVSGNLAWAAGDMTARTFTVPILDNIAYGVDKSVNLALSAPTGTAVLVTPETAVLTIVDDDASLSLASSTYSVKESAASVTITVNRKGNSTAAVSVDYATSDGSATAGSDYTATAGTFSWAAGDLAARTFTIPISNDTTPEDNETVTVTLSNPTGGAFVGVPGSTLMTIVDNDHPGTIAFSAANYSVDENDPSRSVVITGTRTGGSDGAVAAAYTYTVGTAVYGSSGDYSFFPTSFTWADGDSAVKTFTITINPDNNYEGDETAILTLSPPSGGAVLGTPSTAVLTIIDREDQPGTLALSSSTYSVAEDAGVVTITVSRTGGYNGNVTASGQAVAGTAISGTDYSLPGGFYLTWGHADTADKSFTIPIYNNFGTGDKTLQINLNTVAGGALRGSPYTAVVTIVDDEGKSGAISLNSANYSVAEDGGAVTITATRSGGSTGAASVDYATTVGGTATAGADYTSASGTLAWAAGESGGKSFTVPILTDALVEGDETFNVSLGNLIGSATLGIAATVVTIEGPAVAVLDPWPATPHIQQYGATATGSRTFTIGTGPNRLLLVTFSAAGYSGAGPSGQTFNATYGGKVLTQAALQNTNTYGQTWIGYLSEADIAARSGDTLSVSVTGTFTAWTVYVASYINVNQSSPVAASGGSFNNTNGATITPTPLAVAGGGYGIYNWANTMAALLTRTSDNEGYTEYADVYTNGIRSGIAAKPFPTATSTQPKVTWSAGFPVSVSLITLNKYGAACASGTCLSPTLTSPTAAAISSSTATLGAVLTDIGGTSITSRGTVWSTTSNPIINSAADGGSGTGSFSQTRTGLPAATQIYYRGYATNSAGIGYSTIGSFYTEPSTQATGVSFSAVDQTSMKVNWTRGNGDGVIVLMRQGAAVNSDPLDGIATGYTANSLFGGGTPLNTDNFVVYKGPGTSVTVSGLALGTSYYLAVYEYKGIEDTVGVDQGINYRPLPATSNQTTSLPNAPTLTFPTATAISSTTVNLGANITADGGTAITARGTVWGLTVNSTEHPEVAGGTAGGIFSQTRTGLEPGKKIYYRGYATNSAVTGYSPGASFYTEPATQAAGLSFSDVGVSTMTVSWTRGTGGEGVIVLMKQGTAVSGDPLDGTYNGYTANPQFAGGSQIGAGNYLIYKGNGTSVTVTGLTPGVTYHLAVHEYMGSVDTNGLDQGTNYLSPAAIASQGTIANITPNQPVNASPANGATWVVRQPQLTASAFADGDVADTHLASQWLVSTGSGATFDAGIVYNSNAVAGSASRTLPAPLALNTVYYWKVRYQDSKGVWSIYSTETSFTTTSLVTGYHLEEASGTTAADFVGSNTGTISDGGTSAWGAGFVGNGLVCDGLNDRLTWGYAEGRLKNNFSLEAMVKTSLDHQVDLQSTSGTSGTSGQKYVFGANIYGAPDSGMGVSVGMNGISVYEHSGSYMPPLAVYNGSLGTGWNHIVVTYTNKQPRIYLNGNLVSTGLTSPRTNVWISDTVCSDTATPTPYGLFNGSVDEVKIYGAALSAVEVLGRCVAAGQCPP